MRAATNGSRERREPVFGPLEVGSRPAGGLAIAVGVPDEQGPLGACSERFDGGQERSRVGLDRLDRVAADDGVDVAVQAVQFQGDPAGRDAVERADAHRHLVGEVVGPRESAGAPGAVAFELGDHPVHAVEVPVVGRQFPHVPDVRPLDVDVPGPQDRRTPLADRVPVDVQPDECPVQVVDDSLVLGHSGPSNQVRIGASGRRFVPPGRDRPTDHEGRERETRLEGVSQSASGPNVAGGPSRTASDARLDRRESLDASRYSRSRAMTFFWIWEVPS